MRLLDDEQFDEVPFPTGFESGDIFNNTSLHSFLNVTDGRKNGFWNVEGVDDEVDDPEVL